MARVVNYDDCGLFVGLTRLFFFLVCAAIGSSHSPLITLALQSSKSMLLRKNEKVFRTRYTFDFTVRKWSVNVRQWHWGQNRETWKVCDWMLRVKHRLCVTEQVNRHLSKKMKKTSVLKTFVKSLRYTDEFFCWRISPFWKLPVLYNCKV